MFVFLPLVFQDAQVVGIKNKIESCTRMVLICNNNVLSIDQFHKNRCSEKNEIKNIIINYEKIREKYKETPSNPPEPNTTYADTIRDIEIRQNKSIFVKK